MNFGAKMLSFSSSFVIRPAEKYWIADKGVWLIPFPLADWSLDVFRNDKINCLTNQLNLGTNGFYNHILTIYYKHVFEVLLVTNYNHMYHVFFFFYYLRSVKRRERNMKLTRSERLFEISRENQIRIRFFSPSESSF